MKRVGLITFHWLLIGLVIGVFDPHNVGLLPSLISWAVILTCFGVWAGSLAAFFGAEAGEVVAGAATGLCFGGLVGMLAGGMMGATLPFGIRAATRAWKSIPA